MPYGIKTIFLLHEESNYNQSGCVRITMKSHYLIDSLEVMSFKLPKKCTALLTTPNKLKEEDDRLVLS